MLTNDNEPTGQDVTLLSEPHGRAALLLVESLIHGLCENWVISTDQAIAITERAMSVQADHADATDGAKTPMWQCHALLSAIAASLKADNGGDRSLPPKA